jgi:heme/copper-type cytochrome/quinol oxidase subunit 2
MRQLSERAYLSLATVAFLIAQGSKQSEAPGGRGDDPGTGGGLAIVIGIAIAFLVAVAVVFFLVRLRAGKRTNPGAPPKSPRGRTGV